MKITSEELVRAFFMLFALGILIFIMITYLPAAANEFKKRILGIDNENDVESIQEQFKNYLENEFYDIFRDCRDSKNTRCFCTKDEFKIPNKFSLSLTNKGSNVEFEIISPSGKEVYDPYTITEVNSCLINGAITEEGLRDNKIIISKDTNLYANYNIGGKDFKTELNPLSLFYKQSNGKICVADKDSLSRLGKSLC